MEKKPFLTEAMAQEIIEDVPTPFHVYDEKGIRENVRRINKAFSWNKGFKEYFAVKALPNPVILQILKEEGCGVDCSSLTELMLSEVCGFTGHPLQKLHHGGVVQIDVGAQLVGLLHILHGGLVGGEHDIAAGKAAGLAQHQLGQGGAVHAAALFLQDLQDDGVGQRLDGKILPEALVPAEGLVDAAGVLTDALFVVDVERGGHVLDDLLGLLFGQKRSLFHNILPSRFYSAYGFGAAVANVVYSLSLLRRQLPRRGSLTARQSLPP